MQVTARLEDNIIAERNDSGWDVLCIDGLTGDRQQALWTDKQFGAVMALATGGDDYSPELTHLLYEIAEPLFINWPNTVQPIP